MSLELKGAVLADPSSRPTVVKWVLMVDRSFILSHLHLVRRQPRHGLYARLAML
jgi:hypothetical protein